MSVNLSHIDRIPYGSNLSDIVGIRYDKPTFKNVLSL